MKKILITVFFFITVLSCSIAYSKPVIDWYILPAEPVYITEGENKGKGFGDILIKLLTENISEYKHRIFVSNLLRIKNDIQKDRNPVGTFLSGLPDRLGQGVRVSAPVLFVPPIGVVIRKEDSAKFRNGVNISLNDLLGNTSLTAGIAKGGVELIHSSAGKLIESNKNIVFLEDQDMGRIFKMLLAYRFDYSFVYPFAYQAVVSKMKIDDKVAFFNFKEQSEYQTTYIFFSNTPEAEIVMKKADQILKTKSHKEMIVNSLLQYIPESIRAETVLKNGLQ
jgi:uncharacterized protein (TIGR02285 family)